MAHKPRQSAEEKIRIVRKYLSGEIGREEASRQVNVDESAIRDLIMQYRSQGALGLCAAEKNSIYSPKLKERAVEEYLARGQSQRAICEKYKIRSTRQLRDWIRMYNSGIDFKQKSGGSRMSASRKTAQEERIKIARECLGNGNNYGATAIKYNVSYQQVFQWVKKFSELGEAGLEDRRGRRIAQQAPRTEVENYKARIAQLEHELYMTKMERDLPKKIGSVGEGRGISQVRQARIYSAIHSCANEFSYAIEMAYKVNGPMEGFWGILKREHYYGKRFTGRDSLTRMIEDYIFIGMPIYIKQIVAKLADAFDLQLDAALAAVAVAVKRIIDRTLVPELRFYQKGICYRSAVTPFGEIGIDKELLIADMYLLPDNGYEGGFTLLHRKGLTTQMPRERLIITNAAANCAGMDKKLDVVVKPPKAQIAVTNKAYLETPDVLELLERAPVDVENPHQLIHDHIRKQGLHYDTLLALADKHYN